MQQKTKQNKKVKRLIHNETIWQHRERVTYNSTYEDKFASFRIQKHSAMILSLA